MRSFIAYLVCGALLVGCGGQSTPDASVEQTTPEMVAPTTTTSSPSTSAPLETTAATTSASASTTSPTTIPSETGSFDDPVIGTPQEVVDATLCSIIPTGNGALTKTGFGKAAGPATPISSTMPGEPACIMSGANVGEISFAVSPLTDLQGDISPDGTWTLVDGNTAYMYCSEEEAGEPGCALLIAIDDENALTVFVFLPTNDLANLGNTTVQIGELAMEGLPDA